jgi:hypothetical protein
MLPSTCCCYCCCCCSTTLEFFSFANPLSRAEMNQWANYGGTAGSRMLGQNVTLVVRAEAINGR